MPTYEYSCENGHHFEEFQSMVAAPMEVCPVCGGRAQRLISGGTGLIFKGSGFYITDYAKKSTSTSTESKPAEKSETKTESVPKTDSTDKKSASKPAE